MSTPSRRKVKVLLFGAVEGADRVEALLSRLRSVHASARAGPFDVAFCVGRVEPDAVRELLLLAAAAADDDDGSPSSAEQQQRQQKRGIPVPLYLQYTAVAQKQLRQEGSSSSSSSSPCWRLAKNLYLLRDKEEQEEEEDKQKEEQEEEEGADVVAGLWRIPVVGCGGDDDGRGGGGGELILTVASCPPRLRSDSAAAKPLLDAVRKNPAGVDLLLSTEWPQGIEALLQTATRTGADDHAKKEETTTTSYDMAEIAKRVAPRYHVAPAAAGGQFRQSPPFELPGVPYAGRFLALCPVAAGPKKVVGKDEKFVHAVGLQPVSTMSSEEPMVAQRSTGVAAARPCPYGAEDHRRPVVVVQQQQQQQQLAKGLSREAARRIQAEERRRGGEGAPSRWELTGKKRLHRDHGEGPVVEADPTNTTLFLHGLHQDVTGRLQSEAGDDLLRQAFSKYGETVVRRPAAGATSSFCFLEFSTHEAALACLDAVGETVTVEGVELEVRWAAQKKKLTVAQQPSKRQRLTESEAKDSSTAYFKLLLPADEEFDVNEAAEVVRRWMERTLEDALAGDNDGEERVTAETEPALQVQVRVPETQSGGSRYGFLDFASHAAANMALATLTGSTDGGRVLEDAKVVPEKTVGQVYLHWAQARDVDPEKKARDLIEDASGFKFERKHFPADSRKDCWFCLASEDCEKHLITGVYNTCYAAMPKGPVHPGHVLLVPVQHGSQGALKDAAVAEEMEMLKSMLRKHASTEYDADLFVFERAIQTKGGYHTHVQCIPVERNLGWKLQKTLLSQGTKIGMDLREVNSDVGIRALLSGDDDGDDNGYFYAEIPIEGHEYKRFLCKQASGDSRRASVPLQFGREVLAAVVGKPELAHWKSCVTDREKEADDAARFRESFKKYNE